MAPLESERMYLLNSKGQVSCPDCGAVVVNETLHDKFHAELKPNDEVFRMLRDAVVVEEGSIEIHAVSVEEVKELINDKFRELTDQLRTTMGPR